MTKYTSLALLGLAASSANAFFLMPCWPVSTQRVDPIVEPGEVSAHVHQVCGGSSFAPVMSYNDTQAASCTTCFVKGDKSNYWIPAMYVKLANGSFERVPQVGSASMYYFNEPARLGSGETMEPFPEGLRMFAGDPDKRSPSTDFASQALNYKCLNYAGTPTDSKTFPPGNCPDGVRAEVTYPSCWDGKNLDSADHKSHMAYPLGTFESGACPSTHPHHLVTLKVEFIFDTNPYANLWVDGQSPFVLANGDPTGYGLHADYVMGWDYNLLSSAVAQCMDEFGVLANCAPFAGQIQSAYVNPGTCSVASFVDEDIGGVVDAMPGCNALQSGPAEAVKQTCNDDAKLKGTWASAQSPESESGSSSVAGASTPVSYSSAPTVAMSSVSISASWSTSWGQKSSHSTAAVPAVSYAQPSQLHSAAPQAFYSQNAAAVSPAPAPAPSSSPVKSNGRVKVVTITDIITETVWTTAEPKAPTTQAAVASPASSQGWARWRREIGDDVHKHHLRHVQRRRGTLRH